MRKTAMMCEAEGAPAKASENIEVGSFRRERKRQRGERCFSVQPGASQGRAEQEVGDGFQSVFEGLSLVSTYRAGANSVKALGTTVISAGSVPSNSPSASM